MSKYRIDDIVKVTVTGRVADVTAHSWIGVEYDHVTGDRVFVPTSLPDSAVHISRPAPAEYPPAAGDVWRIDGAPYHCQDVTPAGSLPRLVMQPAQAGDYGLSAMTMQQMLDHSIELVYRDGWTRPAPTPAVQDPWDLAVPVKTGGYHESGRSMAAALRELADRLDAMHRQFEPTLLSVGMQIVSHTTSGDAARMNTVDRLADVVGGEAVVQPIQGGGHHYGTSERADVSGVRVNVFTALTAEPGQVAENHPAGTGIAA